MYIYIYNVGLEILVCLLYQIRPFECATNRSYLHIMLYEFMFCRLIGYLTLYFRVTDRRIEAAIYLSCIFDYGYWLRGLFECIFDGRYWPGAV